MLEGVHIKVKESNTHNDDGTNLYDLYTHPPESYQAVMRLWAIWLCTLNMILSSAFHLTHLNVDFEDLGRHV